MGTYTLLAIVSVICMTLALCFISVVLVRRSTELALAREANEKELQAEREKNERILQVEELKNERSRLSNERTAIYANRDMVNAQLESGIMGQQQKEEEGGIVGLIGQLAPIFMQNPELLSKLTGFLGKKNTAPANDAGGGATSAPFLADIPDGNK